MAKQKSKPAPKEERDKVSASVRIDVSDYARLSAAAASARISKSAWMENAIKAALQGIVFFEREKSTDHGTLAGREDRTDAA